MPVRTYSADSHRLVSSLVVCFARQRKETGFGVCLFDEPISGLRKRVRRIHQGLTSVLQCLEVSALVVALAPSAAEGGVSEHLR